MGNDWSTALLVFVIAMAISMAIIPLLIRYAPVLGMMDKPDPRKVHATPIPRVGGVGIVLGAVLPLALWLPSNDLVQSYLLGALVLLVFGVWDDIKELGHYVKFVGQFIAVLLVVYHGDLYVSHLPLMGLDPIDETFGRIFTVIAMVGVINAINHSDGLDGLAGGESILSLGAIAYLANQASDNVVVLVATAAMGGVFGFLRFNSHPARVFMGDGGSQFLGFTLAFLVVYLTQISNQALSPALPALLLGLPVMDILSVFYQRVKGGMNWFKATKNHIHHRLLELGFHHYESVIVIYSLQALLVLSAVLMPYEADSILLGIYLAICVSIFASLSVAERRGWRAHGAGAKGVISGLANALRPDGALTSIDHKLIQVMLSVFLVMATTTSAQVPGDLAVGASILFLLLFARLWFGYRAWFLFLRLILYVAIAFAVYLVEHYPPPFLQSDVLVHRVFFGVLVLAVAVAVRSSKDEFFQVTPLDYLVVLIVLALALMSEAGYADFDIVKFMLQVIVLFYGVEVVIKHMRSRINIFTVSSLASLGVVAIRGIL
ncbi:MAG TPA: undecaprenyl/decaprenyl-phosphate alpha-N-acetylglucosaminyl 1-phosphate transferase [Thiolapillus brandeum]|uniref:Undecaprenyl/decaprenyl-phosphate alpha-N-acetylglucosaminyl 1-phosphate transferase n=1 Tax=Thiolapillus brandeum TaxID=1076588 RepID=A0A831WE89_9GAMM|nr:undecaprenyl/decaprenyl-phosphate alpha-N-acetylglucosaminyl 1-phosphate transferase [Thiolapillus brandeum]